MGAIVECDTLPSVQVIAPVVPPNPNPQPPTTIPAGATLLPWVLNGNSRTITSNCNINGDVRFFYFTVPANTTNPKKINIGEYSSGAVERIGYVLRELPDNANLARNDQWPTQSIQTTFGTSSGGKIFIKKGFTYTLEINRHATAPYPCTYYIDLNNSN